METTFNNAAQIDAQVGVQIGIQIDAQAAHLLQQLNEAGFEAYLVGGCVRDALRGQTPKDWDIATSATPKELHGALSGLQLIDTGIQHGTVTAVLEGSHYEITTFRTEGAYFDARHPSSVSFVRSLEEDLARRDFTINALAYHPQQGLIDPFGGARDLEQGILRAVGSPAKRLEEDALRIMRALRFAATLNLVIEPELADALHEHRHALQNIAVERINVELTKMLVGENVLSVLLEYPDVLAVFIPELEPCIGLDQRSKYHCYDVWEHTAHAIALSEPEELVRLTLLFHDVGKPVQFTIDEQGAGHFYGHDKVGSQLTHTRLKRLRFDNETVEMVTNLVKRHGAEVSVKTIPRWLNRLGVEGLRVMIKVKRGDILAHSEVNKQGRFDALAEFEQALEEYLAAEPCFTRACLAVAGSDLIELGFAEGRALGQALDTLLDLVLEGKLENSQAALLKAAKELL
ncbi:MAG: HD domain-containing protein [Coriobacteriia bacterium]|nr:HD domain-containing protein [Coriobacteriia bacterium]